MVNMKTIDAKVLSRMFLAGAKNLEAKKEWINELNVFPVPDGDTGTNMTMTIMSAAAEASALTDPDMETLAKAISSGSLRGARGNSGVILSQLLRGFTRSVRKSGELDAVSYTHLHVRAAELLAGPEVLGPHRKNGREHDGNEEEHRDERDDRHVFDGREHHPRQDHAYGAVRRKQFRGRDLGHDARTHETAYQQAEHGDGQEERALLRRAAGPAFDVQAVSYTHLSCSWT